MHPNHDLSQKLLTDVAKTMEENLREHGDFNFLAARFAGNAARLLQFGDLERRFADTLASVTAGQYSSGIITNIPHADDVPRDALELMATPDLEQEHPTFMDEYATTVIRQWGDHLLPCLERDYDAAFSLSKSALSIESVALTQAILGDTDLAQQSTSRLSDQYRRDHILFVVTMELYRRNRTTEAKALHKRLPANTLCQWGSAHMALCVVDRVPWAGYPYPDY